MLSLLQDLELKGRWWLPDNAEAPCFAVLSFHPTASTKLVASPCLMPRPPFHYTHTHPPSPVFKQAFGVVETGATGLLSNLYMGGFHSKYAWTDQTYWTYDPVLLSYDIRLAGTELWDSCEFGLASLHKWFDQIIPGNAFSEASFNSPTLLTEESAPRVAISTDRFELLITAEVQSRWQLNRSLTQEMAYLVKLNAKGATTIGELSKVAQTLRDLFALLTLSPSAVSWLTVTAPECSTPYGLRRPSADVLINQALDLEDAVADQSVTLSSRYEQFSREFEEVFSRRLETWVSEGLGRMSYALLQQRVHKQEVRFVDFISLIIELEGYHRDVYSPKEPSDYKVELEQKLPDLLASFDARFKDRIRSLLEIGYEPSFRERLEELFNQIPISIRTVICPDLRQLIESLRKYRTTFAHGIKSDWSHESKSRLVQEYYQLVLLTWALILIDFGFTEKTIRSVAESAKRIYLRWQY